VLARLSLLMLPLLISLVSYSQNTTANGGVETPIQPSTAFVARIDFGRYLFASRDAERTNRTTLYSELKKLLALKGHVHESGQMLLRALEIRDQIAKGFIKHEAYLHLINAIDTRDKQAQQDESRLDSDFNQQTAFLDNEIVRIPPGRLQQFVARNPGLAKYRFAVESIHRGTKHTLPLAEEELLQGLSPELTDWPAALYDELQAQTKFESVTVNDQTFDPQRDRSKLASSPDSRVRQEAFTKRSAGFERMAPFYAFALSHLVAANNRLAALHHFDNAADQFYDRSFLSQREVSRTLSAVAAHADIYQKYERIRANHVQRALGLKLVNLWDLDAVTINPEPRFSFDDMRAILHRALAPLGKEYVREMDALLDPSNGRVDLASGPNRRRTGFSKGFPGFSSVFYAGDFKGSFNDMRVIAHEGGHAVHRELMTKAGVIPAYAEGPHFLFESFAILNELLLADYLSAEAKTPELKAWYLEQFLKGKGTVAFVAGAEAELEQRIYEQAQGGKILDAKLLDEVAKSVYAKYSIYEKTVPELRQGWMMIPLMYEDPFYNFNYVCAAVLGLEYYEMLEKDPAGFRRVYMTLLKNGFNAPPRELLKKYLAINLEDPALVQGAMGLISARVEKLSGTYEAQYRPTD
jgi:oligoendopeptidase F